MRDWTRDVIHSLRRLRRSPAHVGTAVLCLAIGVAASSTVFSLLNALLYRELPGIVDRDALRCVFLIGAETGDDRAPETRRTDGNRVAPGETRAAVTVESYRRLAQHEASVAAEATASVTARTGGDAINANAAFVSGNYFSVFGTLPTHGRLLNEHDDRSNAVVAVVSHRFWETHLGSRAPLPSEPILIGEHSVTVVGVAPAGFSGLEIDNPGEAGGSRIQFWLPLSIAGQWPGTPGASAAWPRLLLRVPEGDGGGSEARLSRWAATLTDNVGPAAGVHVRTTPLGAGPRDLPGEILLMIGLFMAVPLTVLAIGCANVANLQVARATSRLRELAVRRSLGATDWQVARLLTAEAAVIAAAAGALGTALTAGVLTVVAAVFPLPLVIDARVFAFTLLLVAGAIFLTGVWPAWSLVRRHSQGQTLLMTSRDGAQGRARPLLVVVQLGLSLLLLVVAALFGRSLEGMYRTASPFMREVLLVRFDLETSGLRAPEIRRFGDELLRRLALDTRISAVAIRAPGGFEYRTAGDVIENERAIAGSFIDPSFFEAMDLAPGAGRLPRPGADGEAIVSARFADQLSPEGTAVGRTIVVRSVLEPGVVKSIQIVGVVSDVPRRPHDRRPDPVLYLLRGQQPLTSFFVTIRTSSPAALDSDLRSVVRTIDPRIAWTSFEIAEDEFLKDTGGVRYVAAAVGGLGVIALILAASGLLATMSYVVSLRTREIGIRMAIGASPASILRLILGQAARIVGAGVGLGLSLAVPIAFLLRAMFEGISPFDPWAIVPTVAVLCVSALVAAAIPARAAARTDAISTIRQDA